MKRFSPLLLAWCVATPMAHPVEFPSLGASASLTNMQINVIDLRPDDGIAPVVEILGVAWAHSAAFAKGSGDVVDARGAPFAASLDADTPEPHRHSYESSAAITSMALSAHGTGDDIVPGAFRSFSSVSGEVASARPLFITSPYTAVNITGQYVAQAWVLDDDPYLYANAALIAWGADAGSTSVHVSADNKGDTGILRDSASGTFSATWSNWRDTTHDVWGGIYLTVNGHVLGIPEPGTYTLMAAGLCLLGVVVKRRKNVATIKADGIACVIGNNAR